MLRLLRDRYVAYDDERGFDLATGEEIRLDTLHDDDESADPPGDLLAPLVEVLDHGRDGHPRSIVLDLPHAAHVRPAVRRAAAYGQRRGYVPVRVDVYRRLEALRAARPDGADSDHGLRDRTLLLIAARATETAAAILLEAAARSPRPHVLLTFRTPNALRRTFVLREARQAYGSEPQPAQHSLNEPHGGPIRDGGQPRRPSADVVRLLVRAQHASADACAGRHAAAERVLRDVAAALERRDACADAARVTIDLGRLLLERGRARAADASFGDAARLGERARADGLLGTARIWQALARTDDGRCVEAESICRAVLMTAAQADEQGRLLARAALARTLLWQQRADEAAAVDLACAQTADGMDASSLAYVHATAVRTLIARGDLFAAGQRARRLVDATHEWHDALPQIMAHTAHLRVLVECGDLVLAEESLRRIFALARDARLPLRAARARLIWWDAAERAGLAVAAHRERRYFTRLRKRLPPLIRRDIERRLASRDRTDSRAMESASARGTIEAGIALVQLAHEEETDERAVHRLLSSIARDLQACRVDLLSKDAGPVTTIMSVGHGMGTHLGRRVLEAGIAIPIEAEAGGRELGMPVRLGSRLLGAIVCRWPLDREPPPRALDVVELAAAVAAPRVDGLLAAARQTAAAAATVPALVGVSAAMATVRRAIERAAHAPFAVLVEGESGAGKELVARAVHDLSARRQRRFCDLNCAALPDDLLEAELFGHARGAFTGAVTERAGLLEVADGGTLFLDELPDLSPRAQAKLLRVLQQQEVRRVGETFSRAIDVRLVTASNRDMKTEVAEGRFRQDLLYRLDVIRIAIPPLRERPEDIAVLAHHFWATAATRVGSSATLTHSVLTSLSRYHWPGNVRELQNVMAALAVAAPARGRVTPTLLPAAITGATAVTHVRLAEARAQFERRCIEVALARAGGNRTRAASALGLTRQGLLKTMARLGL
jgi:DNA-binding NtrC family response regulator